MDIQYQDIKQLLSTDLYKNLVNVEGSPITTGSTPQLPGIPGFEFDAPEANRYTIHNEASLCKEVLNISVTQVAAVVQPV